MTPAETSMGGDRRAFEPTLWTLVLKAKASPGGLEDLIRAYWKPVYFYVRRWGASVEDAKDLTQGFFAEFLRRDLLKDVAPEKGRFRSFLLTALRHFLINEAERARALKRGGGALALDFEAAETQYARTPVGDPERHFKRQWALTVLERALDALAAELPPERFQALREHLSPGDAPPYEQTASRLGVTVANLKTLLHRARARYRELIRAELRASVETDADVEDELQDLLSSI